MNGGKINSSDINPYTQLICECSDGFGGVRCQNDSKSNNEK